MSFRREMSKTLKFTSASEHPVIVYDDEMEYEREHFHRTYENNKEILRKCESRCTLHKISEEIDDRKPQKSVSFTEREQTFEETLDTKRNELELKMSKLDVEESLLWDECKSLQGEIDKIETALEAFLQYIDAVELEAKARNRLCNQLTTIFGIENFVSSSDEIYTVLRKITDNAQMDHDTAFKQKLVTVLDSRMGLADYYREYENRKHDFRLACGNFRRLLSTANLTEKQLDKFSQQYEKISDNFTHCRYVLFKKIPEGMDIGVQTFLETIREITKLIDKSSTEMRELLELFTMMDTLEVNTDAVTFG